MKLLSKNSIVTLVVLISSGFLLCGCNIIESFYYSKSISESGQHTITVDDSGDGGIIDDILSIPATFYNNMEQILTNPEYKMPTLTTLLVILLKFFCNRAVVALDFKKGIAELPCEVCVFSLGIKTTQAVQANMNNPQSVLDYTFQMMEIGCVFILITAGARELIRGLDDNRFNGFHFIIGFVIYVLSLWAFSVSLTGVIR